MLEHCLERSDPDYDRGVQVFSKLITTFYDIQVEGAEHLQEARERKGGLIILPSHPGNYITRNVDIIATAYFLREQLDSRAYYVAKKGADATLKKFRLVLKLLGINNPDRLGQIVVHRKQDKDGIEHEEALLINERAYRAVAEVYNLGEKIVIFPQGGSTSGRPTESKTSILEHILSIKTPQAPYAMPLKIEYAKRNGLKNLIILTAGKIFDTRDVETAKKKLKVYVM